MKSHHYNLDPSPKAAPLYHAYTIKAGVAASYRPSFERGDRITRLFAENSKIALDNGGLTIAHPSSPDKKSIVHAMSILQRLLNEAIK